MFKKLLLAAMLMLALSMQAGTWKNHPQYAVGQIQNNLDAGNYVYSLVWNKVLRYDKNTNQIEMLTASHGLSDVTVKQIYYNNVKQYLVIVYNSSNIDIIQQDGNVINLPVLSSFVMAGDKDVNDVNFGSDNRMYVSTDFGYLVINDETFRVELSCNYAQPMFSITEIGNGLAAVIGDSLYRCPTVNPKSFNDFHSVGTIKNRLLSKWTDGWSGWYFYLDKEPIVLKSASLRTANDSTLLLAMSCDYDSTYIKRYTLHPDSVTCEQLKCLYRYSASNPSSYIQPTPTGFLFNTIPTNNQYYTTDADGQAFTLRTGGGNGLFSSCSTGDGTLWGIGANGLFNNSAPTVYHKPNTVELALPYWAAYNPNNGKLYLTNTANTPIITESSTLATQLTAYTYDGETWRNNGCRWTNAVKPKANGSGWQPIFDRRDPNTWYVGTWYSGGVKVKNDTVVAVYDERNSPLKFISYYRCVQGYGLDSQGNFWMVQSIDPSVGVVDKAVMVLPADKWQLNNAVSASDWYHYDLPGTSGSLTSSKFSSFTIGRGDVKVYTPGNGGAGNNYLVCWRGPIDSEPEARKHTYMIDQDGNQFSNGVSSPTLTADSTGLVWVGVDGIYYFDPANAFENELHAVRPKLANGDYAMEGMNINHIDVDYLNRKWVSTKSNGLYLLNADGTEVLEHFDDSNSPLPSNTIYSVCPMGETGRVMVMTNQGVIEYIDDNAATGDIDENGLTVYPNPVRPTFTGLVTLGGVRPDAVVRVCDKQGNTVAEFTAGNTATWDCCGADGDRVETGRYAIYVSQPDGTFTEQPQGTINVIK